MSGIMIVDDDVDVLAVTKMMLERKGHEVHAFSDPVLALMHLEDGCKTCKIAISDVIMPGITGVELSKYAKEARPDLKFVVMSAMPVRKTEWREVMPFTKYMDDFVPKPFSLEELMDVIQRMEKQQATSPRI
jgi:DNA-binding NtrC family response regulator